MTRPDRHSVHYGEDSPVCPHCREAMCDFRPHWDDIHCEPFGRDESILTALGDCPSCGRPVKVTERRSATEMSGKTFAMLTETDELYLAVTGASL